MNKPFTELTKYGRIAIHIKPGAIYTIKVGLICPDGKVHNAQGNLSQEDVSEAKLDAIEYVLHQCFEKILRDIRKSEITAPNWVDVDLD